LTHPSTAVSSRLYLTTPPLSFTARCSIHIDAPVNRVPTAWCLTTGLGSKQSTRIHGYLLAGRIAELTGSIAYICQLHRAPVIGWLVSYIITSILY